MWCGEKKLRGHETKKRPFMSGWEPVTVELSEACRVIIQVHSSMDNTQRTIYTPPPKHCQLPCKVF